MTIKTYPGSDAVVFSILNNSPKVYNNYNIFSNWVCYCADNGVAIDNWEELQRVEDSLNSPSEPSAQVYTAFCDWYPLFNTWKSNNA